jgi:hypothetical protein
MGRITGANFASLFGLLLSLVPAVAGLVFAFRPNERLLSLMRPLTLAALFSALCSLFLALTSSFHQISRLEGAEGNTAHLAAGMAEGLAPVTASFACLAFAWACVAVGMRRSLIESRTE